MNLVINSRRSWQWVSPMVLVALGVMLFAFNSNSTEAHAIGVNGPNICGGANIPCGHGGVNAYHTHLWVTDDVSDLNDYYIEYILLDGTRDMLEDTNGSQCCSGGRFFASANPIVSVRGCSVVDDIVPISGGDTTCNNWVTV